ncbi:MAG: hypothetical protein ACFB2W_06450 [Leptolyngbyaceae cyanobacterium]
MGILRFASLGLFLGLAALVSSGGKVWAQSLSNDTTDSLVQLDRAICLQQWPQAVAMTSRLIASSDVSPAYRQDLLLFRRQLQELQEQPLNAQPSCDRTLPLFLTLDPPTVSEPQPLDWNRALETLAILASSRPVIDLNDSSEPDINPIPAELTRNSPELLTSEAIPIDTTDGFSVVGGSINGQQQVYSFLARLGDRVSLEVDITRTYTQGDTQLYIFDQTGRLLTQSGSPTFQGGAIQAWVVPKTDIYFAVVGSQGTVPILDARKAVIDWQTTDNNHFDYTLTLTGVTPYQSLVP